MIHASEVSFFISTPQLVSTLGFLLAACDLEETKGLVIGFDNGNGETEIDFLLNHTLRFVHNWSEEFRTLLGPGQYHRARRIYAHPKFVNPLDENTFQFLRMFRVEEKVFEGCSEVRQWATRSLKTQFAPKQQFLSMWKGADNSETALREDQKRKKDKKTNNRKSGRSVPEDKSTKPPKKAINDKKLEFPSWRKSRKDPGEQEKKPPILVWISHAIVELPADLVDARGAFVSGGVEYLRVHESPLRKIQSKQGTFNWNALLLPIQARQLTLIIFYGFGAELCSMEDMRKFVFSHRRSAPCLVKKRDEPLHEKRDVYIPFWTTKNFTASRIAQHLVASMDLRSLFVQGGFGNLAVADAVPSSSGDPKRVTHVQHFGLLSFRNYPHIDAGKGVSEPATQKSKSKNGEKMETKSRQITSKTLESQNVELIKYPICVIIWDSDRELPAYMGKVVGEPTEHEMEKARSLELAEQKRKCCC